MNPTAPRVVIVDGGWGGHRLALVARLSSTLAARGIDVSVVVAEPALESAEGRVHLRDVVVSETVSTQHSGEAWWRRALAGVPPGTERVLIPKCDNVVRHPSCVAMLRDAPWAVSGLLLKVAPEQDKYLSGRARADRANRLKAATAAHQAGALDRLGLWCGYGDADAAPDQVTSGSTVRWVQDVPLLPADESSQSPTPHPYALVAGEISWRKRVPDLLALWPTVWLRSGVALALVGPVHDTAAGHLERARRRLGSALLVRDGYVDDHELARWHAHADVVLGTFDDGQYAASGAVATAQNLGRPLVTYGNAYVDRLLTRLGGAVVLPDCSAGRLATGVRGAGDIEPVSRLVGGARDAARRLTEFLVPVEEHPR